MIQTNYSQNRDRLTDIQNKLRVTNGDGEWGRDKSEVWDWQIQTAVYNITNSKVLLYTAQGTILRIL